MNQMIELKKNSDSVENQIYEFLKKLLDQLKDAYEEKLDKLKDNYLELGKKEQLISFHQDFISNSKKKLDKIDFLNHWEIYQKMQFQISNQKLQMEFVNTANLIDSLDIVKPGIELFGDKAKAKEMAKEIKEYRTFAHGNENITKEQVFKKGAQVASLVNKKQINSLHNT